MSVIPVMAQIVGGTSEGSTSWVNTEYNTTEGTDFWVTYMRNTGKGKNDVDLFLRLFATARQDADVQVWFNNDTLSASWNTRDSLMFHVPANGMGGLSNEHAIQNPYAYVEDKDDTYKGVYVHSTTPISLYALNYFSSAYDAALVLPIQALHKEYVIQNYNYDKYATEYVIIATENGTEITIHPRETFYNSEYEIDTTIIRADTTIYLNRGNTFIYRSSASNIDLTGSYVCANNPIGVFQGNQAGEISDNFNHFYESSIPTDKLGKQYVVVQSANHNYDNVRLTAVENNTMVYINGTYVTTLQAFETYDYEIEWAEQTHNAVYIETSAVISCGLFIENYDSNGAHKSGSSYTNIPPIEYGVQSIISASFAFEDKYTQAHYINVVTPTSAIGGMQLDGTPISEANFHNLPVDINNIAYSYAQLNVSSGSHTLTNNLSTFSTYIYGLGNYKTKKATIYEAYAYSGGFRVNRPVDILIDDQYRKKATICINEDPLKFSAVIKYDYDSLRWQTFALGRDSLTGNKDSVLLRDFDWPGLDSVRLIVSGHTPICHYPFQDTVVCYVMVHDTVAIPEKDTLTGEYVRTICYGKKFSVHYKDPDGQHRNHQFIADTVTPQNFFGKKNHIFKLNKEYFVVDSFKTTTCAECDNGIGCDSMIYQRFIIRPNYQDIQYDTICVNKFPYMWHQTGEYGHVVTKVDTTDAWKKPYILTSRNAKYQTGLIDTMVNLKTICNCDSIIHLHLTVLPIYQLTDRYAEECGNTDTIKWPGHLDNKTGLPLPGHNIYYKGAPLDHPLTKDVDVRTTFVLTDSLKIKQCKECYGDLICDSIWTFRQTIKKVNNVSSDTCLCEDGSFVWLDTLWLGRRCPYPETVKQKAVRYILRSDTTLYVRYNQEDGCDSIYQAKVHFNPIYIDRPVDTTYIHICEDETFVFEHDPNHEQHQWQVEDGEIKTFVFTDTVPTKVHCKNQPGCDSAVVHVVYVHPAYSQEDKTDTICQGDTYLWIGHTPMAEDSSRYYWVEELSQRVRFDSIPTDSAGIFHLVDSLHTTTCAACKDSMGCDSVWTKMLIIGQVYDLPTDSFTICENDTLWWRDRLYAGDKADIPAQQQPRQVIAQQKTPAGQLLVTTYTDTAYYSTIYGCDSVYHIHITVLPAYPQAVSVPEHVMCDNDTLHFCNQILYGSNYADIPEGTPDSLILSATTLPYDKFVMDTTTLGCDSLVHHRLMVHPTYHFSELQHVCQSEGGVYIWTGHSGKATLFDAASNQPVTTILAQKVGVYYYKDSCQTNHQCDSVYYLELHVDSIYNITDTVTICEGESYTWTAGGDTVVMGKEMVRTDTLQLGPTKYVSDDYVKHYQSQYDCDSTHRLHLIVNPKVYTREPDRHFSTGDEPLVWNSYVVIFDHVFQRTLIDTLDTHFGCDSIVELHIAVDSAYVYKEDSLICQNEPFTWIDHPAQKPYLYDQNGNHITTIPTDSAGTFVYADSIRTSHQTDSVHLLTLHVLPVYDLHDTLSVCEGDSVLWDKQYWKGQSMYQSDTLMRRLYGDSVYLSTIVTHSYATRTYSCDSLMTLHLIVHPRKHTHGNMNVCDYDGYMLGDLQIPARPAGFYHDIHVMTTMDGCDSVLSMDVTVNKSYHDSVYIDTCEADVPFDYVYDGTRYTFSHSVDTLLHTPTHGGTTACDSVRSLFIHVYPNYYHPVTMTICEGDSVFWDKAWRSTDSVYTHVYQTKVGHACDSVEQLTLTVLPRRYSEQQRNVCQGDYEFYEARNRGQGAVVPTADVATITYVDTITSLEYGCDSVIKMTYYIRPVYMFVQDTLVCQDRNVTDWKWTDADGNVRQTDRPISIAEPGVFFYGDTLHTHIYGCDSLYGIRVHVAPSYYFHDTLTICENERVTWQGRQFTGDSVLLDVNDSIILAPGLYYDTAHYYTWEGCDSIYYLQLHVTSIYDTLRLYHTGSNETFIWQQQDYLGQYNDLVWSASKLDTVWVSAEEALQPQASRDTMMCHADRMLHTIHGCDSMSHMDLIVHPAYFFYTDTIICSNVKMHYRNKTFWLNDTVYTDYQKTKDGCDSIYQLHLHIKPAYYFHRNVTICDNEVLYHESKNGREIIWDPSHLLIDTLTDAHFFTAEGCDSTYRYHLTIHSTYFYSDTVSLCSNDAYPMHDHHIVGLDTIYDPEQSGYITSRDSLYKDSLSSQYGCDSVYWLLVHYSPQYYHVDYDTICDNQATYWHGNIYSGDKAVEKGGIAAGDYTFRDAHKTSAGCDSVYELKLCVHPTYFYSLIDTTCVDVPYAWEYRQLEHLNVGWHTFDTTYSSVFGCDSTHHLELLVLDTTCTIIYDTICESESYILNDRIYTKAGDYKDTTLNAWGCHHFTYLHLTVIPPTRYQLYLPTVCADDREIAIGYTYEGRPLEEFSIYFDSLGHSQGFEDIIHRPIQDIEHQIFYFDVPSGNALLYPPVPYFDSRVGVNRYMDETKYQYPQPDTYAFRIVMHNGICTDTLQTQRAAIDILYPSWIHEQHWNDGIVLYSAPYNGGYEFSDYQWYHNDEPIPGQVREFLYLPPNLELNPDTLTESSVCPSEYSVLLTRKSDGHSAFTCPVCPVLIADTIVPRKDYYSVVPTLVLHEHPVVWILSSVAGEYEVRGGANQAFKMDSGSFQPDSNNYAGEIILKDAQPGETYFITLTSSGLEPRTCIVLVK